MDKLFSSASLKLTGWYLLILMIISLVFSVILYGISSTELKRSLRMPGPGRGAGLFLDNEQAQQIREERYEEGRARLLNNLAVLNFATLVAGGGVSYLLARRTLRPIHEAMEAQGRFTSDASHELRTPLAILRSEIEVGLRNKSATKKDYQKLLASNLDEVERLRELSDRLLQLTADRELPLKEILLDEVAIDALNRILKPAQQKSITVINDVQPLRVRADLESLSGAVTILLDNALKNNDPKTSITLNSELRGKFVYLNVTDHGPGIAARHLPYVFDRFYRADESRSRQRVKGYGLGLSIAKRIVEQHNGHLSVTSEPGKGATFTIRLPTVS